MGSKNRYAKELLPIILKDRKEDQWYVEPFCGGCNMIDKVTGNRLASDSNYYLIEMFKSLVNGFELPDYVSEDEYQEIKNNKDNFNSALVGFVGFGCSYSGKWFGGFARNVAASKPDSELLNRTSRNYCSQSKRNLIKQIPLLKGVVFHNKPFWELEIPNNSIVYCDPPYFGTTKYKDSFDHKLFWEWCRIMIEVGHKVFVSEYNAPEGWHCVWQKQVNNSLTKNTGGKKGIEKLFVHKSQL